MKICGLSVVLFFHLFSYINFIGLLIFLKLDPAQNEHMTMSGIDVYSPCDNVSTNVDTYLEHITCDQRLNVGEIVLLCACPARSLLLLALM
jgi:hypothetical protein